MGADGIDDMRERPGQRADTRQAGADEESESPIRMPVPALPCLGCAACALLFIASFGSAALRSMGFFIMGTAGVVAMYLSAVCCCLLIAFLAVPVVGGIITAERLWTKLVASVVALAVTAVLAWIFIVNPILDIPYLSSPSTIELENVSFGSENVNDSVFFSIVGTDTGGRERSFDVDRGFAETWDPADDDATVTYLPHSETVLSIE